MLRRYRALIIYLAILIISLFFLAQLHQVKTLLQSQSSRMLEIQLPQLQSIYKSQHTLNDLHGLYLALREQDSTRLRRQIIKTSSTTDALLAATINNHRNNPLSQALFRGSKTLSQQQQSIDAQLTVNRQLLSHAIDQIKQLQNVLSKLSSTTSTELAQDNNAAVTTTLLFVSLAELTSIILFIAAFLLACSLSRSPD